MNEPVKLTAVPRRGAPPRTRRPRHALRGALASRALLIPAAIFYLVPLYWMFITALKPDAELSVFPPTLWTANPQWHNFVDAVNYIPFGRYFLNTVIITALSTLGAVISNLVIAYGFSRVSWPGRDVVFAVVVATIFVPFPVTMIPLFTLFAKLHWVNTFLPLIVPAFFGNPFFIFLLRQFLLQIPFELSDAARVDGANELQILSRIILPLCIPPLTIVMVFQFLWTWNDFFEPLIYIGDTSMYTLQLGLSAFRGLFTVEWHLLMAAALVSVVPQLIVYFFAQRKLIGGIASVGLKG